MESSYSKDSDNFSIQKEIKKYLIHWKWFLLSAFLFGVLGVVYLKKTSSVYNITSTILIKDNNEGRGLSELAAFGDLAGLSGGNNDIDDEVDIIKSKTLLSKVVKDLNLNIGQYAKIGLRNVDLYGSSPIRVRFEFNDLFYKSSLGDFGPFRIVIQSEEKFILIDEGLDESKEYSYSQKIKHKYGEFEITKTNFFNENLEKEDPVEEINLSLSTIESTALNFQQSIFAQPKSKRSSLLDISLKSSNKKKAYDVINTLVKEYNKEAIGDKNLVSRNTIEFVDERLGYISKELDVVETEKTDFKKQNNLTDIKAESELFIDQIGDSQKNIFENETQLDIVNSVITYLDKKNKEFSLLPANIGLDNSSINQSINEFNKLVLEHKKLMENSTELNPLVQDITFNITSLKANLLDALKGQKRNLQIMRRELNKQKSKINSKITSIPKIEKDFRTIERQQKIKENLYLFLLKKREEVSISMAVTAPPAKVIDRAYSSQFPVAPRRRVILLASLLLGLLIPFGVIYSKDLLDTKVHEKSDIDGVLANIPILVEVARVKKGAKDSLEINDRSVLGESFRILRTNLNYIAKTKKREGKAIRVFVTSTVKGEGKTFVSFNTVLALADSKKKVLVIGADIRNPQLHRYLKNNKNLRGLSEFLYDDSLTFNDVVNTINFNNHDIDYITSGRIPPNPSELLMNGRLKGLLDEVDDLYDYVIVDTAPTMLVTDTLIICESADITMFVVRAGYTEKQLLNYSKSLHEDGKVKNMTIVLNDVKEGKIGYGYSYGYGGEKKSFFEKILRK